MKKSALGYTLVELLVVLTIIIFLSSLGFIYYKTFSSEQIIDDSVNKLQSFIRAAQTNAQTAVTHNNNRCQKWIVRFATDKKTISLICQSASGDSTKPPNLMLAQNVTLDSINTSTSCNAVPYPLNEAFVTYDNLYGDANFIMARGTPSECIVSVYNIVLTLKYEGGGITLTKDITLGRKGRIDAQN